MNRPETVPFWRWDDNVLYFSVTSEGQNGNEWARWFAEKQPGTNVSYFARSVLLSPEFAPTCGITTKLAVLKGCLFRDDERLNRNIWTNGESRGFQKPNAECACLTYKLFNKANWLLGIELAGLRSMHFMHEPIIAPRGDSEQEPRLLAIGAEWFDACFGGPTQNYPYDGSSFIGGYAFKVP